MPVVTARTESGLLGLDFDASRTIAGENPILGEGCALDCADEDGPATVVRDVLAHIRDLSTHQQKGSCCLCSLVAAQSANSLSSHALL